jgi:hypothetical protein
VVTLVGAETTADTTNLPPLRYAGIAGRQLHALAERLPLDGEVGIYHALGDEKAALHVRANAQILAGGFDSLKPAAVVFEHLWQGPFAQLAITRGLTGPFHILESGEASGALALVTAVTDLGRGRCEQALVGGFTVEPARAWLMLLVPGSVPVSWSLAQAAGGTAPADDPLGLAAIAAALAAPPRVLTLGGTRLEIGR